MRPPFTSRFAWSDEPNPLTAALAARRAAGLPVLDLTGTNPTRVGLAPAGGTVAAALAAAAGLAYEPDPRGLPSAREAVAAYHADRGETVSADDVVLTSGTSESYALLFKVLADPGDDVLVPQPSYPLFEHLAALEGLRPVPYPVRWHPAAEAGADRGGGAWRLDPAALRAAAGPRTRAVVAVSPNNPTGNRVRPGELAALAAVCEERGAALILDEVFHDYPAPRGADPQTAAGAGPGPWPGTDPEAGPLRFRLSGLSKVCALPQLKLAWIVAAGPPTVRREALGRLEFAADAYLSVASPVQHALPRLLAGRHPVQARIHERLERNDLTLAAACRRGSGLRRRPREGGWYGVVELPPGRTDEAVALGVLADRGVLLHPGFFYDAEEESLLVVSLLTPGRELAAGLRLLTDWLGGRGDGG